MIERRGEFRDCPNAEEREVWTEGDEEDTAAVFLVDRSNNHPVAKNTDGNVYSSLVNAVLYKSLKIVYAVDTSKC